MAVDHEARLMPPGYVKPYVKRNKTDAAAIAEAVTRPTMRFVLVKSAENQGDAYASPHARATRASAHNAGECSAGASERVGDRRTAGHKR
jgi:transposase